MTQTTLVPVFLAAVSLLTACKKKSACSDESLAALRTLRVEMARLDFDAESLERADEKIDALSKDLSFDGSLVSAVGYLREEISSARELLEVHGDFAEDGDLSGLDDLASAQANVELETKKVIRAIESADEYCEPR